MLVERFDLKRLEPDSRVGVLRTLQIGDSLFFAEHKEAHSMRVLSYYFLQPFLPHYRLLHLWLILLLKNVRYPEESRYVLLVP